MVEMDRGLVEFVDDKEWLEVLLWRDVGDDVGIGRRASFVG